jgi:hypothetical protein
LIVSEPRKSCLRPHRSYQFWRNSRAETFSRDSFLTFFSEISDAADAFVHLNVLLASTTTNLQLTISNNGHSGES